MNASLLKVLKVGVHAVPVAEVVTERFEIVFRMKSDARDIADLCEEVTRADMKLIDECLRGERVPVQPWPN